MRMFFLRLREMWLIVVVLVVGFENKRERRPSNRPHCSAPLQVSECGGTPLAALATMDLASDDESEDDRDRTPPYGRQSQEDEEVEEEVVVVAEEEDETEEEDPAPAAPPVPDDLNELLGNIAAQLTVEFEETVDTWHPAGKVTLPQLTLTACPGYGPP